MTSREEDRWFQEKERRLVERMRRQAEREKEDARKRELRELHYMHCPKCGHELTETEHHAVLIDVCHTCGGVWLDAGELEEIVRRSEGFLARLVRESLPEASRLWRRSDPRERE